MARVRTSTTNIPRAAIYLRVSTGPQEQGTSLDSQRLACLKKAESIGAEVVAVCSDVKSGALLHSRSGIQQAVELIEAGKADRIIIYDMSRYSRDSEHQQAIAKRVIRAGGRLDFCTLELGDISTADGGLAFGMMGIVAEHERKKIAERTHQGSKSRAKSGIQPIRSRRPYGYWLVDQGLVMESEFTKADLGRYFIKEDEAAVVRKIFDWYSNGASIRELVRLLQRDGHASPLGRPNWGTSALHYLLGNPIYKGTATYGRHQFAKSDAPTENGKSRVVRVGTRDEGEYIGIPAPAIIDPEVWDEVQERLSANVGTGHSKSYLLSGLLRCPHCDAGMTGVKTGHGRSQIYDSYRCYIAQSKRIYQEQCVCGYYRASVLESLVLEEIKRFAASPEVVRSYYQAMREKALEGQGSDDAQERHALKNRLIELNRRQEIILESQFRAVEIGVDSRAYESKLMNTQREKVAVQDALRELEARNAIGATNNIPRLSAQISQSLERLSVALEEIEAPVLEKRRLLARVIERIDVAPKTSRKTLDFDITVHLKSIFVEK
jgi:site-specific DNA recombinase